MSFQRKSKRTLRKRYKEALKSDNIVSSDSYSLKFNKKIRLCLKYQKLKLLNNTTIDQEYYECRYVLTYDRKKHENI